MAFAIENWAKHSFATADGTTINCTHTIYTNDDATAFEGAGFLNALYDHCAVGDIVIASLDINGTPDVKIYQVTAKSAGAVTITATNT